MIWTLIVASCIFYAWNESRFLWLILAASFVDFFIARAIWKETDPKKRKCLIWLSVSWNLGILCYFKYARFIVENISLLMLRLGWKGHISLPVVILPLGISFFTFEALSYSIDVYNTRFEPSNKVSRFLFFITFFPHLVAGPIVRAKHLLPQLEDRFGTTCDTSGIFLILWGFTKKLLLADPLGGWLVDPVFADPRSYSRMSLLLAVYSYAFQIFLDFSGYTDIAIGVARLFGLDLGQNFNAPYLARSCSEFWHRWHISLSTWFRDYVFIPLGGSRVSRVKIYRNIMITFLLSGLWHGANWKYLIWGGLHGFYVVLESALKSVRSLRSMFLVLEQWVWLRIGVTFHLVCLAWIFFRASSFAMALDFIHGLYSRQGGGVPNLAALGFLGVAVLSHLVIEPRRDRVSEMYLSWATPVQCTLWLLLALGAYHMNMQLVTHKAFIYFKF